MTISSDQVSSLSGDTQSGRVHWTHYAYDSHGRLSTVQRYHLIPSGSSTAITNYYDTTLGYDAEGRVNDVVQDVGLDSTSTLRQQETQVKYDFMGRPFELDRGVIVGTTAATMVPVRKLEYDGGVVGSAQQVGDGYVTKIINYFGTGSNDYTGEIPSHLPRTLARSGTDRFKRDRHANYSSRCRLDGATDRKCGM